MTPALALCAFVGGALAGRIETQAFTLSWIHSVEKIRWEEDWQVTPAGLVVAEARIRGTGAGMEPPDGAVLRDGSWHYRPALPPLPQVVLADAGVVPDRELCARGECRPLHAWLRPVDPREPVTLAVCPAAGDGASLDSRGAP